MPAERFHRRLRAQPKFAHNQRNDQEERAWQRPALSNTPTRRRRANAKKTFSAPDGEAYRKYMCWNLPSGGAEHHFLRLLDESDLLLFLRHHRGRQLGIVERLHRILPAGDGPLQKSRQRLLLRPVGYL